MKHVCLILSVFVIFACSSDPLGDGLIDGDTDTGTQIDGDSTDGDADIDSPCKANSGSHHKGDRTDPVKNCQTCHANNTQCLSCHNNNDHTLTYGLVSHKEGNCCQDCHGPNRTGGMGPACINCHSNIDGDTTDGDTTDGDTADGDATDGDIADGDNTDGDTADGDTTDGDTEVETPCIPNSGSHHKGDRTDPVNNCQGCHPNNTKCFSCHNNNDHSLNYESVSHMEGHCCQDCHGPDRSGGMGPACSDCH